jgi:hypothetical protein
MATHLEDDVLLEDVLDDRDDVFGLGLGELDRPTAAPEDGSVGRQLGNLGELLGVERLRIAVGRRVRRSGGPVGELGFGGCGGIADGRLVARTCATVRFSKVT